MTFDERAVTRDKTGKFDEKTGSAPSVTLDPTDQRRARLEAHLDYYRNGGASPTGLDPRTAGLRTRYDGHQRAAAAERAARAALEDPNISDEMRYVYETALSPVYGVGNASVKLRQSEAELHAHIANLLAERDLL